MAKDEAKRFLEEFKPGSELGKAVKAAVRKNDESTMAFYARVAAEHGFDFDADELEAAYDELQAAARESLEVVELDDDELDQMGVAGGWCWFDEECSKAILYKKKNPICIYTYEDGENCFTNDDCNTASNEYYCTVVEEYEEHGNGH